MSHAIAPSPVLLEIIEQHIAVLTLNRPEARNAISSEMTGLIESCLIRIEDDPQIRVCILAAKGEKTFCAGADLKEIASGNARNLATKRGGFAGFVQAPRRKPWIAAINATAVGGGLEMALACDMLVCAEQAELVLPEVKRGLVAAGGGMFRLPRVLPRAVALEMIVSGEPLSARRAYELGMANYLVAQEQVFETALNLARKIASAGPLAVRESLQLAHRSTDCSLEALWGLNREAAHRVLTSEDARIGPKAFLERRPAQWTGR
ncbi:enoyl-CoA hydratase [Pseudomonas sp. PB120]|uniref:enoyl-CoA hydratase-related protein n=1 Tax=Pseudomonas sp. PB120 TaxID=2494700 RepID=UPI0012FE5B64|nr:enoyl-CoA hydratase-related protein [Pseudomonas sp. PB120]MVV48847.1 enoyl-CoA hydratase [Pseudomonas sp. PB120]